MVFTTVQESTNDSLKLMTGGTVSFNNMEDYPSYLDSLYPYVKFVMDYDEAQVMTNFISSWELYG